MSSVEDSPARSQITILIFVFALILVIGLPLGFAVRTASRMATQSACSCKLCKIGNDLFQYEGMYGELPAPVVYGDNDRPLYSWRVLIAVMDQPEEYGGFKLYEAWDSPNNIKYVERMPDYFYCESDAGDRKLGFTSYVALLKDGKFLTSDDAEDGELDFLVVEMADSKIPWTKPQDLEVDDAGPVNDFSSPSIRTYNPDGPEVIKSDFSRDRIEKRHEKAVNDRLRQLKAKSGVSKPEAP